MNKNKNTNYNSSPVGAIKGGLSIQEFLDQDQKKDLLRLLTAGSVDDGKSTLISGIIKSNAL